MKTIEQRAQTVLSQSEQELQGMFFPESNDAIAKSQALLNSTDRALFLDVDDAIMVSEPHLRAGLNSYFNTLIPGFRGVGFAQVQQAGGRYYMVPEYQQAAKQVGEDFYGIYTKVIAVNETLHAGMAPHKGALELQQQFAQKGFRVVGYPTARPHELARVTAASLLLNGFQKAPVIDVVADSGNPQHAKISFFVKHVLPQIRQGQSIYFVDDHVETAIGVQEACDGKITVLVPLMARNRTEIQKLRENNIAYGTLTELAKLIQTA